MKINLLSPINTLSYGKVGVNFLHALTELGHDVALFPIGNVGVDDDKYVPSIKQGMQNAQQFDPEAVSLRIFHQHSMAESIGRGPRIGMPIFELNKFSDHEKHHLKSLDAVIVNSGWAKEIVDREVGGECYTIPLGVDTDVFKPIKKKYNLRKTIFLNIGKIEVRKGHDILPFLFDQLPPDSFELWMMWDNPFLKKEEQEEWENFYRSELGDAVKFLPRVQTQQEVAQIMNEADVGIFPSRAEGFNLPLLEMMACGKNVIATNYSAHTQFCKHQNCYLVDIKSMSDAVDGIWFKGQGQWATLNDCMDDFRKQIYILHTACQNDELLDNADGIATAFQMRWRYQAAGLANLLSDFT